jgi:hypothetical protein
VESKLLAGAIADAGHYRTESFITETAIGFGLAAKRGTDPASQAKLFDGAAGTDRFIGFALQSVSGGDLDNKRYNAKNTANILKEGPIWVELDAASGAVVAGDPVAIMPGGKVAKGGQVAGGVAATKTFGANNSKVKITAKAKGTAGNGIKFAILDPGGNDKPLEVTVVNNEIRVSAATSGAGAITSTAAQVIAAVNSCLLTKDLVLAENGAASDGTGEVAAAAAAALENGAAPAGLFALNLKHAEFKNAGNAGDLVVVELGSTDGDMVQFNAAG